MTMMMTMMMMMMLTMRMAIFLPEWFKPVFTVWPFVRHRLFTRLTDAHLSFSEKSQPWSNRLKSLSFCLSWYCGKIEDMVTPLGESVLMSPWIFWQPLKSLTTPSKNSQLRLWEPLEIKEYTIHYIYIHYICHLLFWRIKHFPIFCAALFLQISRCSLLVGKRQTSNYQKHLKNPPPSSLLIDLLNPADRSAGWFVGLMRLVGWLRGLRLRNNPELLSSAPTGTKLNP